MSLEGKHVQAKKQVGWKARALRQCQRISSRKGTRVLASDEVCSKRETKRQFKGSWGMVGGIQLIHELPPKA